MKGPGTTAGWMVEGVCPCSQVGLLGGGRGRQGFLLLLGSTLTCSAPALTNRTALCPVLPAHPESMVGSLGPEDLVVTACPLRHKCSRRGPHG